MKINCVCKHCANKFLTFKSHIKAGEGKFCSNRCYHAHKVSGTLEYHGKYYRTNAYGYYVSCENKSDRLHRVIWKELHGDIPSGFIIHHKDGNKKNNVIENLELIEWGAHTIKHRTKYEFCTVERCNKPHDANGLCSMHRARKKHEETGHW